MPTIVLVNHGIINASTLAMHRTWLHAFALNLLFIAVIAKLRDMFNSHVPLGYQDESGFHFGASSRQND